eukprot:3098718-Pyramimonas_sp.AAC.1
MYCCSSPSFGDIRFYLGDWAVGMIGQRTEDLEAWCLRQYFRPPWTPGRGFFYCNISGSLARPAAHLFYWLPKTCRPTGGGVASRGGI